MFQAFLWWWVPLALKSRLRMKWLIPTQKQSHQGPESDWGGPKDQGPSCAALLGSEGGWWCCPAAAPIPCVSWVGGEDSNGILQVRRRPSDENLPLSLGTQQHLVKLLLVFTSPDLVPDFAAFHTLHCNVGVTHQDQRCLEVAVSGYTLKNYLFMYLFISEQAPALQDRRVLCVETVFLFCCGWRMERRQMSKMLFQAGQ